MPTILDVLTLTLFAAVAVLFVSCVRMAWLTLVDLCTEKSRVQSRESRARIDTPSDSSLIPHPSSLIFSPRLVKCPGCELLMPISPIDVLVLRRMAEKHGDTLRCVRCDTPFYLQLEPLPECQLPPLYAVKGIRRADVFSPESRDKSQEPERRTTDH